MSSNARNTRNTLSTRVSALEGDLGEVRTSVNLLLNHFGLTPSKPVSLVKPAKAAKVTKPATKASTKGKARKTVNRKPVANGTVEGKRCLVSANRKQFIADHDWATDGSSVRQLAEAVVTGGQPLTGNWAIGPKRTALLTGVEVATVAPKAKKGKKAKAQVVVEVTPTEPAKATAASGPRDAKGHITPKAEWAIREALAETGKYDRFEIDAKTAKAMALLNA